MALQVVIAFTSGKVLRYIQSDAKLAQEILGKIQPALSPSRRGRLK